MSEGKYRQFKCFCGRSNILTFWNMCIAQPLRHEYNRITRPRSCTSFFGNLISCLLTPVAIVLWIAIGVLYGSVADFCELVMWLITCGYCGTCCTFDGLLSIRYKDVEDVRISHVWGGSFFEDTWLHSSTSWQPANPCCTDVCFPYVEV